VLKWVVERLEGKADATETPIGNVPTKDALDLSGLDLTAEQVDLLLTVDSEAWRDETEGIKPHYERFGDHLPAELWQELEKLQSRLG
jgi:phosphoenolpyruvate carboxykinase (GTP)